MSRTDRRAHRSAPAPADDPRLPRGKRRPPAGGPAPSEDERRPANERPRWTSRLRFLITPRWIALIIGALAFALACYLFLAPWQFGRSAERAERNAAIAAALQAPPVPITELMSVGEQPAPEAIWHRVTVTGTFDESRQAYIRLRQNSDGQPASEVVVPLVTADGTAVLVDRGYVPFISVQQQVPLPPLPSGTVTVTGRVQADQTDPKDRPPVPAPDGRMQYTAASSELAGPGPVYGGYLQLTPDSPGVLEPIGVPQRDSGPFFSYALQWLAFGAIAVLGIGYFIYREVTDPAEEEIYLPDEHADSPAAEGPAAESPVGGAPVGGGGGGPPVASPPHGDPPDLNRRGGDEPAAEAPPDREAHRPDPVADRARRPTRRRRRGFDKSQLYDPQ